MKQAWTKVGRFLVLGSDTAVIFLVLVNWRFFTNSPLTLRTALTVFLLLAVVRISHVIGKAFASVDAAPAANKSKRVFVKDPEAVLELAKLTGYEAIRRFAPYLGKWMTISGKYEGMTESLLRDSIHLSLRLSDDRPINLAFAVDRAEELRGLQIGQCLTAIGQIQHLSFPFKPENCELVRAEPLRRANRSALACAS